MPESTRSESPMLTAFAAMSRPDAKLLILGSMPGVASLDANRYYAHPRNAFWSIMQSCLLANGTHSAASENYEALVKLLLDNRIALWDVLEQCHRPGSLDSAIDRKTAIVNDFTEFLNQHRTLDTIIFNGKTAEKLFRQKVLATLENSGCAIPIMRVLPSTSPAMASLNLQDKTDIWRTALSEALQGGT